MGAQLKYFPAWIVALALWVAAGWAAREAHAAEPAFLAVAADRGFQGNEEIRDAFDAFAAGRNAQLVFATDSRTRDSLDEALARIRAEGARRVVVLPVFLSAADPKWRLARSFLDSPSGSGPGAVASVGPGDSPVTLSFAPVFGESYLAVEALADRLRLIHDRQNARLVVAGYGADRPETHESLLRDWQRLAERAAEGFGFETVKSVVWYDSRAPQREARREESRRALAAAAKDARRTIVVPFHLGRRLDGMMSFDADLKASLPAGAQLHGEGSGPEALLATWMAREANRQLALNSRDLGVIVLAHGSDFHWNETMRKAVQPLEARYPIEYVFSMADQPLIERAVRRLERRGARAAVIVRVFGLTSSFEADVERMIGADVEKAQASGTAAHHGHGATHDAHEGHHHGDVPAAPPRRIRSTLAMTTVGGLEANPLFAAALLDRARELSRDPRTDTVILVAHGTREDARNVQWLKILSQLAAYMEKSGGTPFRAIRYATWREDWPDKRDPWVKQVQAMVLEAARDGGRAIVIPARTNGRGPEGAFLEGLKFELGEGFAPHPLFTRWVEEQVLEARRALGASSPATKPAAHAH